MVFQAGESQSGESWAMFRYSWQMVL